MAAASEGGLGTHHSAFCHLMSSDGRQQFPHQSCHFIDTQSVLKSNFGIHGSLGISSCSRRAIGPGTKTTDKQRHVDLRRPRACKPTAVYRGTEPALAPSLENKTDTIPSIPWEKRGDRLWQRYVDCCLVGCSIPLVVVCRCREELTVAEMRYGPDILKPIQRQCMNNRAAREHILYVSM